VKQLVLWPRFTGSEWRLPTEVEGADRLLVGWRCSPESVDGGPPPIVAAMLVAALQKHATLTYASALGRARGALLNRRPRVGRHFVWKTSASADEAAEGIFHAAFFEWTLQSQVAILGTPGAPLTLDERYLELPNDATLFGQLKSAGAEGVLLPGVDGAVAAIYSFSAEFAEVVRRDLEDEVRVAGGRCVVATGAEFAAELRGDGGAPPPFGS
jgi:hypothetical protein